MVILISIRISKKYNIFEYLMWIINLKVVFELCWPIHDYYPYSLDKV